MLGPAGASAGLREPGTSRPGGAFKAGLWSFADQGLVSAASFVLTILLARSLPADEFGLFVLLYLVLVAGQNIQTSLIVRPHNLLGASLREQTYRYYTAGMAHAQLLLAGLLAAPVLIAAGIAAYLGAGVSTMLLALAFGLVAYQVQEFLRQERYTAGRSADALVYDLISYGGQIALLLLLAALDLLSVTSALLALGATSLLAAAYGLGRTGIRPGRLSRLVLRENWLTGRWILGDNAGQWLSSQLYPFLAAAILGPAATASLRILGNVLAPTHVIFQTLTSFATPRAARAYAEGGEGALLRFLAPTMLLAALPFGAYLLLVSLQGNRVLDLLYGPGHGEDASLIGLFAAAYVAQYVTQAETIGLLVLGRGRLVFVGRLVSIALTLTLGVLLTWRLGVGGAIGGLLASNLAIALTLAYLLYRRQREALSDKRRPPAANLSPVGGES